MLYKILVTSIIGPKGAIVELPDSTQTNQRVSKGLIAPAEQYQPVEKKTVRRRKAKE